ncbi:MAG: hypothetical protein P4L27_04345 [Ignavibacteriaceae bacterium]|nr:hypothetical protein [Ignavibacteriaceae bacterium]
MYLIRDVFQTKPGKAKDLVKIFKNVNQYMPKEGLGTTRVMTDVVSSYWTVVLETEVESLNYWEKMSSFSQKPEVKEIMKDYMTLVEGGHREIFKIEE